jgi:hypothetical protein
MRGACHAEGIVRRVSSPIVLSLFDRTGTMVHPWVEAGYECWIVDIKHPRGITRKGNLVTVGADVLVWLPPRREYAAAFSFSPCTDQAVSGARWFKDKGLGGLARAVELVERSRDILEWTGAPWMLENPVGTISKYWRKPDRYVHPWQFAGWNEDVERENYTKKTGLWIGGGFVLPETRPAPAPHRGDIHKMAPSADRGDRRSVTPTGFARAVFEANNPKSTERAA